MSRLEEIMKIQLRSFLQLAPKQFLIDDGHKIKLLQFLFKYLITYGSLHRGAEVSLVS